jgi:hypothetical protein
MIIYKKYIEIKIKKNECDCFDYSIDKLKLFLTDSSLFEKNIFSNKLKLQKFNLDDFGIILIPNNTDINLLDYIDILKKMFDCAEFKELSFDEYIFYFNEHRQNLVMELYFEDQ